MSESPVAGRGARARQGLSPETTVPPPETLRVAVWQCHPEPRDPAANLARLRAAATSAAEQGARVVVAPEAVLTGYDVGVLEPEDVDGAVDAVAEVARSTGIAVVAGVLRVDPAGTWRNSGVIASAEGVVVHDKAHLFGGLDATRVEAGDHPFALGSVDGVPVATMVCYDVEFPEAVRAAALAGARAVLVPTANMEPYVAVNDVVVRSRAIENATPVVYANHCGSEGETRYVGASVVVGPDGAVLARGGPDGEELLVVDLPLRAAHPPDGATYLADRRPEIYDAGGER